MNENYSIVIQWSQKDNCFVASLPEWNNINTQGESYEQALNNAQKVLTILVESSLSQGHSLPEVTTFKVRSAVL